MPAIVMLILAVQVLIVLVTMFTVLFAARGRRPIWSSLGLSLIMIAAVSWQIADRHSGTGGWGSELVAYLSPLLLGMGIMACLILIRQRRGLDGA